MVVGRRRRGGKGSGGEGLASSRPSARRRPAPVRSRAPSSVPQSVKGDAQPCEPPASRPKPKLGAERQRAECRRRCQPPASRLRLDASKRWRASESAWPRMCGCFLHGSLQAIMARERLGE